MQVVWIKLVIARDDVKIKDIIDIYIIILMVSMKMNLGKLNNNLNGKYEDEIREIKADCLAKIQENSRKNAKSVAKVKEES